MTDQRLYSQSVTDHTLRQWDILRQSQFDTVVVGMSALSLESEGRKGMRKSLIKTVGPPVWVGPAVIDDSHLQTPTPLSGENLETIFSSLFADDGSTFPIPSSFKGPCHRLRIPPEAGHGCLSTCEG